MVETWAWSSLLAVAGGAVAWAAGWRLARANRVLADARLSRMVRFYRLLGAAAWVQVVGAVRFERAGAADSGLEVLDLLFWVHHGLMVGALWHAMTAASASPPRPVLVVAPLLLAAEPVLRMVEAVGFLLLLTRGGRAHLRRQSVRSLEGSLGFFLVFVGHALFAINRFAGPAPLGARDPWGEALVLVGLLVLWWTAPRRRVEPG